MHCEQSGTSNNTPRYVAITTLTLPCPSAFVSYFSISNCIVCQRINSIKWKKINTKYISYQPCLYHLSFISNLSQYFLFSCMHTYTYVSLSHAFNQSELLAMKGWIIIRKLTWDSFERDHNRYPSHPNS